MMGTFVPSRYVAATFGGEESLTPNYWLTNLFSGTDLHNASHCMFSEQPYSQYFPFSASNHNTLPFETIVNVNVNVNLCDNNDNCKTNGGTPFWRDMSFEK